jgi:transposase InsO family protein
MLYVKNVPKKGHFAKVCRSRIHNQPISASALSEPKEIICLSLTAKTQKLLPQSFVDIHINSKCFKALIDSGSSSCFINDKIAQLLHLKVHKTLQNVTMASTSESILSPGYCIVDISLLSRSYPNLQLTVMPNLCTDVILGYDFMSLHRSISFSYNNGSIEALSICSAIPMSIDPPCLFPKFTLDCRPVSCPSRHFNSDDRQFIQQEISQLLEEGTIEPSNSAWRAQVVITKNSNHRKRLVIDYSQTVNRFTQRDAYPLPLIEDLVHQVSQNNVFSTLDLKSAYHQIPLKHDEKPYTAFEANGRLYQFTRIPFGLTNAVSAFQRIMNDIITANQLKGVYSYLDDIIVAGKTLEEHDKNMARFLEISRSLNMTLNEAKCSWRLETINFLGYTICHGEVKPDSNRLEPLRNLPLPMDQSALKRVIGLFSYYSKWIQKFSEKIIPLTSSSFPLNESARKSFYDIKSDIEKAALSYIDEGLPFVVETDASDNAIAATLNQNGQPVAFFSRKLSEAEKKFPSIEKEAYAIVEALRKWRHFLLIRPFSLLTDQEGVSFMFNRNNCGKIKNSKIQRWRMELSCFEFDIQYRPGKDNAPADALSRICGAVPKKLSLELIHKHLCHPGISRLYHYVRHKNLSYSVDDIRKVCRECPSCSELKPRFLKTSSTNLIKATRSFERISIDFMGPKASSTNNRYLLTVVDEYSRFPFAFPCPDMNADTVIRCLQSLFTLCGTPEAIHSDRGSQFMSDSFQQFLRDKNIAQTRTSPYNPAGNGQCERFNQTIWKAVQLTVHSRGLKDTQWESVLPDVLHSIRSLLCTSTNTTPHERFFNFNRKSTIGASVPSWLLEAKSVLIKRHVRPNKNDPLVDRAEVIQVNPNYAVVRLKSGRETSVSLRDIAPCCDAEEEKLLSNQELDGEDLQKEEDRTQEDEEHLLSNQEGNINHDGEELKIGESRNIETVGYRKSNRQIRAPRRMNL